MNSNAVFVTGIGTDVGKTLASAVIVQALGADYWKPVQAGDLEHSDSHKIVQLCDLHTGTIHPETYRLSQAMSPHAAAKLDNTFIDLDLIRLPESRNWLVVEGAGGLLVPLNEQSTIFDLMQKLSTPIILVARHYLGSINHTLLSLNLLKTAPLKGIIYCGEMNQASLSIVHQREKGIPFIHIPQLDHIDRAVINRLADEHRPTLKQWLI